MYRAILFDLDGTLLDNSEVVIEAYYSGMMELGYEPKDREYIKSLLGKSTFDTARALGFEEKDIAKIDAYFWLYFGKFAQDPYYIPNTFEGVKEILELLKQNKIPTAIVTSNKSEFAVLLMKKLGLHKFITAYVGFEDVNEKKPSPEPLYKALKKLNLTKNNFKDTSICYVGDSITDIETALNAGVISICIPEKEKAEAVQEKTPDHFFSSMKEFYKFIEKTFI